MAVGRERGQGYVEQNRTTDSFAPQPEAPTQDVNWGGGSGARRS